MPTAASGTTAEQIVKRPDDIDRKLLDELARDGRLSMKELAERVGISRANAHWRVGRLRENGSIKGFTVRIEPRAVGLEIVAIVMITVEQGSWRTVRAELESVPEIEYIAFTSGDFDFLVLVRAQDMTSMRDVVLRRLHSMEHIRLTKTIFAFDEVRRGPLYDSTMEEPA